MRINQGGFLVFLVFLATMALSGPASSAPATKTDASQPVSPRLVAVMPLSLDSPRKGKEVTTFEETIRTLAGDALREQGFTVLTGDATLRLLQQIHGAAIDYASWALSAAREAKAEYFVTGMLSRPEGRLLVLLRLFDLQGKQLSWVTLEGKSYRELRETLRLQLPRLFHPLSGQAASPTPVAKVTRQAVGTRSLQCEQLQLPTKPFVAMDARRPDDLWLANANGDIFRFDGVTVQAAAALGSGVAAVAVSGNDSAAAARGATYFMSNGAFSLQVGEPKYEASQYFETLWWDGEKLWAGGGSIVGSGKKQWKLPGIWFWDGNWEHGSWDTAWDGGFEVGPSHGKSITAIHGRDSATYAVGGNGIVLRRTGDKWTEVPGPAEDLYRAVWVNSENDVWIAGRKRLQHWDGTHWSSSPMGADSIACAEPKMCFATSGGKPYGWSGSDWVPIELEGGAAVSKVFAIGPEKVWFIGGRDGDARQAYGTILSCKVM